ncbi:hypothetical protein HanRHA438_Chr15g0704571 [Helianthus annuus]|nr:hypothetical protein HanRHA438_Chr15g0704571 [Helianthus annuus]
MIKTNNRTIHLHPTRRAGPPDKTLHPNKASSPTTDYMIHPTVRKKKPNPCVCSNHRFPSFSTLSHHM